MLNVGQFTMVLYTTLCPMADHHCYATQVENSDTQQVQRISSAGAAFLRFPYCFPVHSLSPTAHRKKGLCYDTHSAAWLHAEKQN
jgi:hypothetical protein